MPLSTDRPGYAEVASASHLAADSAEWLPFLRDVLKLPFSMLPAVRYAVKADRWRVAKDPVAQIRNSAENWDKRRVLSEKPPEDGE